MNEYLLKNHIAHVEDLIKLPGLPIDDKTKLRDIRDGLKAELKRTQNAKT